MNAHILKIKEVSEKGYAFARMSESVDNPKLLKRCIKHPVAVFYDEKQCPACAIERELTDERD